MNSCLHYELLVVACTTLGDLILLHVPRALLLMYPQSS